MHRDFRRRKERPNETIRLELYDILRKGKNGGDVVRGKAMKFGVINCGKEGKLGG